MKPLADPRCGSTSLPQTPSLQKTLPYIHVYCPSQHLDCDNFRRTEVPIPRAASPSEEAPYAALAFASRPSIYWFAQPSSRSP